MSLTMNAVGYCECSAETNQGVYEMFETATEVMSGEFAVIDFFSLFMLSQNDYHQSNMFCEVLLFELF